jgi:AcrR family transcriptional regulator
MERVFKKMTPKLKQTRARSEDKKADQFERILETGKQLFLQKGTQGFSMRNLAQMLGMTKNNLYNYIESKRELWIAIRNRFYSQFKAENLEIIKNHEGTSIELLLNLFEHFLEFAERDYDKFKMMFNVIDAPPSNKIGPIEQEYEEFGLLVGNKTLIQEAINKGEIANENASLLSLFSFCILMGVAYIGMNRSDKARGVPSPVWETTQLKKLDVSNEEFKEFTLKVLEFILRTNDL